MKKKILGALAIVLVLCVAVGGTLAWLSDTTETVTNVFTFGNVDIDLTENEGALDQETGYRTFAMIPGETTDKDPTVTVKAGSEDSWVFVKVEESSNLDEFITYAIAEGWTQGDGTDIPANVYYREYTGKAVATYAVLADDQVTVKGSVTKEMIDAIAAGTADAPTLSFTAYAIQKAETLNTAALAWAEMNP